ncbi:sugar phosphate isomerase/epimerase family protein [Chloroflexota bacterium]
MKTPIGIQMYSVRENLAVDFDGTVRKIAEMGYAGVETYKFPEHIEPLKAKALFDDLGLIMISAHADLPLGDQKQQVLDTMAATECPHLVSPWMDPAYYTSEEKMKTLAEKFNQAALVASENGMKFSIHNHAFEYASFNGAPAINTLRNYLEPTVLFQVDTYWVQVAGLDPSAVVAEYGERAPLLHIKDGPATKEADMTALGEGVIDVPGIIKAGEPHTEWLIVELDRCATDMLEAVEKSYKYLADLGYQE